MLEPEAPLETTPPYTKPPPNWPQRGEVVFEEVSLRYSDYTALVLKSISLTIKAGEKVSTRRGVHSVGHHVVISI